MARLVRLPLSGLTAGEITLNEDASHYLLRVHRLGSGDAFVVFDPELAVEADAELVCVRGRRAVCSVRAPRSAPRSRLSLTLLQGFGKADRVDQVVRDATALGASRVVIVETERSVVKLSETSKERVQSRRERWRTIAAEAARQSGQGAIPELAGPLPLLDALREHAPEHRVRWCCDVDAGDAFGDALAAWQPAHSTLVLIGPEGGLSPAELKSAREAGLLAVRLGPATLRTETAATVVLGSLFIRSAAAVALKSEQ